MTALSKEVDNSTDSGIVADVNSSKEESGMNNSMTQKQKSTDGSQQGPTPKKQKPGWFLEEVTVKHGSDASVTFFCKVSTNKDGSHRTQSLSDEEEEASGGEGDSQEKVTSAPFHSDDNPTSPEAKHKLNALSPKPASKKTGQKSQKKSEEVTNKKDGEEATDGSDDSVSSPEMELLDKEEVVKVGPSDHPALVKASLQKRIEVYIDDQTVIRVVRGSMMGLESNKEPTQVESKADKTFKL